MEFLRPILKDDPTNIFDAIVDKLYKDSDYSLEKVQGVVKGRLREIEYEKRTTMGAAQKFENVSMKVIHATKEQMITEKVTIDFCIFLPDGKAADVAKEIFLRIFNEYIN